MIVPKFPTLSALMVMVALAGSARPQPAEPPPKRPNETASDEEFPSPDAKVAQEIDRLIPLLGAPDYKKREEATRALIEIGAPALAALRQAYHNRADDLETQLRVEAVVRAAYLNHHVFDRHGFLGVQLAPLDRAERDPKGQRRPVPENGVRIQTVISDTAAHRAGLQGDDIVVAVDGKPLSGNSQDAVNRFRASIPQFTPGTKIRMTVLRGEKTLTIDATIGRLQEKNAPNTTVAEQYYETANRFAEWWDKSFAPEGPAPAQR
jgi:hypothetical protein